MCLTLSQLVREVYAAQPAGQSQLVAGRFNHFTRQYMSEVGLDMWIQENGGLDALLSDTVYMALSLSSLNLSSCVQGGELLSADQDHPPAMVYNISDTEP